MPGSPIYRRRGAKPRDTRQTAHQRGYDAHWQKASKQFLRANPLCVVHQARGYLVPANVVDHIKPHKGDYQLFWDRSNWQSLCKRCHDRKTAREDGGFGREARTQRQVDGPDVAAAVRPEAR